MRLQFPSTEARRGDEIDRFILFVDQLEQAIELLNSGSIARQRMALVTIDNLAEMLLSDLAEELFLYSDMAPTIWSRDRSNWPSAKRSEILNDFTKRITLAKKAWESRRIWGYEQPLLDEFGASVFGVAHRYRNEVYHAGTHNVPLLQPLGRLYARAVGDTFVRSLPKGHVMGGGIGPRLAALDHFAWRPPDEVRDMIAPHDAARRIVSGLSRTIPVDFETLKENLAEDIEERCAMVEADLQELQAQDLDESDVRSMLESAQLWAAHRGDEELIRLEEERQALLEEGLAADTFSHTLGESLHNNERAQFNRVQELRQSFSFSLHPKMTSGLRRRGERLRAASDLRALIEGYERIDSHLKQMEAAMEWVIRQWDREVERQADIARGK